MIRPIVMWPDPILKQVSQDVKNKNEIIDLVPDMIQTMRAAGGVGLSAIQVGVPLRVFVIETEPGNPRAFVNPDLINGGSYREIREGCLSLPGIFEWVKRYERTTLTYGIVKPTKDPNCTTCDGIEDLYGLASQAAQHEYDHLQGRMFVDDLSPIKKNLIRRALLKK